MRRIAITIIMHTTYHAATTSWAFCIGAPAGEQAGRRADEEVTHLMMWRAGRAAGSLSLLFLLSPRYI